MSRNGVRGERSRNVFYQANGPNLEKFRVTGGNEKFRLVYNILDIITDIIFSAKTAEGRILKLVLSLTYAC